jgi:hypothetical protein
MTTNEIADVIIKELSSRSFPIFLTTFCGRGIAEADVFGINKNGYMYEFEIKRSRSDFLCEFKNKDRKHRNLSERKSVYVYDEWDKGKRTGNKIESIIIPNRYFFVCEPGLINIGEIPEYAGLIHVEKTEFREVKTAPLLHKNKANCAIYERVATILSQRIIFGCSYYTYKNRKPSNGYPEADC